MLLTEASISRRKVLKSSLALAAVAGLVHTGLVRAAWPKMAYEQKSLEAALQELYGNSAHSQSDAIILKIPEIAENGAVVPIQVKTSLKNVKSISLFVDENPNPLVARFKMGSSQRGIINTRIKMGKSSNVVAVVESDDKLYSNKRFVKVTIGGCGG